MTIQYGQAGYTPDMASPFRVEYGNPGWNEGMIPKESMAKSDLSGIGIGAAVIGGALNIYGQLQAGDAAYASKEFQAAQLEQNAGTALAVSQKVSAETRRQTGLVQSRIISLAAASGASASDPGVINLIANQKGIGAYNAAMDLYKGEDEARTMRVQAAAARYEGEQAKKASRIGAVSSFIQTAATIALLA